VTLATYVANRPVEGEVVTVLDSTHEARVLKLIATDETGKNRPTQQTGLPTSPSLKSAVADASPSVKP